jgi:hypothetical protein
MKLGAFYSMFTTFGNISPSHVLRPPGHLVSITQLLLMNLS